MTHPQSDSPLSPISVGGSSDSQASPASADSPGSPAVVGPLGPVGRVTAASYSGASASAVAFPDPARRPYPDPRPAGSAVSASSALHAVLEDSEEGTLMETLGMEVVTRDANRTEVRMPVDGARQVVGILHGGATAAIIETAASVAARAAAPDGAVPVGAELTVSHLRSVSQGWVKATAVPLHRGRRTVVYQVTVTDDEERTIAVGTLRSLFT
ncbi:MULTISPECIES: PaaI family thioesterase [Actinomyces]|mgnify:FL=1|uniref:PaaI family thioesterase n=1 Tax=Actinomyces TaxID=1654 RepID=UPI000A9657D5|nr:MULTISPECIES: hotdog fold thioesterase [Actinomyces]